MAKKNIAHYQKSYQVEIGQLVSGMQFFIPWPGYYKILVRKKDGVLVIVRCGAKIKKAAGK